MKTMAALRPKGASSWQLSWPSLPARLTKPRRKDVKIIVANVTSLDTRDDIVTLHSLRLRQPQRNAGSQ